MNTRLGVNLKSVLSHGDSAVRCPGCRRFSARQRAGQIFAGNLSH